MKDELKSKITEALTIAVYGESGSGKTALVYKILKLFDKQIYFLKHPLPSIIEKLGYKNLRSIETMEEIEDCVIYIDEPQLHFGIYKNKSNSIISKICSLARQKNITIIMSTSDTRVFGKANESYFDLWLIKNLDYAMVKNGSKIKQILEDNSLFDPRGIVLKQNEFLVDFRKHPKINGKDTFNLTPEFTNQHSKPYAKKTAKILANGLTNNLTNQFFSKKIIKKNSSEIIKEFKTLCHQWVTKRIKEGEIVLDECSKCGCKAGTEFNPLLVHHNSYSYPFKVEDTEIVCKSCHSKKETHLFLHTEDYSDKEITLQTPAILPAAGPANICEVPRVRIPARGIK